MPRSGAKHDRYSVFAVRLEYMELSLKPDYCIICELCDNVVTPVVMVFLLLDLVRGNISWLI